MQNQNWLLRIITEARTKFTSPPLQKTKRLMLSDLESVKPKVLTQSLQHKAEKDIKLVNMTADQGTRKTLFLELPFIPCHPSPLPQANYRMNLVPR